MRTLLLALALTGTLAAAEFSARLKDSANMFEEVMATPDRSIPQDLLEKSQCIVLVPGMKKGAFIIGGKYGRGFAFCRRINGTGWGPPAAVRIEGGSFGFQIGGSSTDVIMLVMNKRGMEKLLKSKFTLGADASIAAGPVGRTTTAQTDALLTAEILSWSRSKGVFAGVSLDGATLRNDMDVNEAMYGKRWSNEQVITSGATPPPSASRILTDLNKYSMKKG
jgi:lipid-binding SYLF domain-containing protein